MKKELNMNVVQRKNLSDEVVDHIVQLLIEEQLKPGDKLPPESELAEMLSVSRPVIREGMRSLESLSIIQRKTKGGTYFTKKISSKPFSIMLALSTGNINQIVETRMILELGLVTLAVEKITEEELEALQGTIEELKETKNNYVQVDREFHRIIAQSGSSNVIEGFVDSIMTAFDKINYQMKERDHNLTVIHHQNIYNALKKRDQEEAFRYMYEHLVFIRNKIIRKTDTNTNE